MESQLYSALIFPLLLLIGQALVALGQRKLNQRMDEGEKKRNEARADTEAKRKAEAEWRENVDRRLDAQDERIFAILKGQTTQMRSDLVHKAHRYIDDLGCASTEEKDAFYAQYKDYCAICNAHSIKNSFVDEMARQVMDLPTRPREGNEQ